MSTPNQLERVLGLTIMAKVLCKSICILFTFTFAQQVLAQTGTMTPIDATISEAIYIERILVDGNTTLDAQDLRSIVRPYEGRSLTGADIVSVTNAITKSVRVAGSFAAKVIIAQPEQISDGVLRLQVLEGLLPAGGVTLGRSSERVDDGVLLSQLSNTLKPRTVLNAGDVERAVLLTNDLPGISGSENVVYPGPNTGEAGFELFPHDEKLVTGEAYLDSFGSSVTGRYRVGGLVNLNSPTGNAERLTLNASLTDEGTTHVILDANIRLGASGLRGGIGVSHLDYKTDEPGDQRGTSFEFTSYLHYPFIRSRAVNLYGEARYSYTTHIDESDAGNITDRVLNVGNVGLHGDMHDGFLGGGTTSFETTAIFGNVDLDGNPVRKLEDAQTANTQGSFTSGTFSLSRLQHITGGLQSYVFVRGQISSKPLDSSRAISFGGPFEFPGYSSGEVFGDEGAMIHADLRYNVPTRVAGGNLQLSAFIEHGWIESHVIEVIGGIPTPGVDVKSYHLQTAGIGLSQQWDNVALQGVIGWQVDNEIPVALLDGDNSTQAWVHLVYRF